MNCFLRFLLPVAALWLSFAGGAYAQAEGGRYDALGKVLMPLVNVFSAKPTGPERALTLTGKLEEATGLPPELANIQASLAVEYPDKLKIHSVLLGQRITLCRQGDTIWVHPGSALKQLLATPEAAERLPKPNKKYKLQDFELPLSAKELFFLPALFQVAEVEPGTVTSDAARVLDLQLMPELAKSAKVEGWSARLWLNENTEPMRLSLTRPKSVVTVKFDEFRFARSLPPETWVPTAEQQPDVFIVPPARYDQLVRALLEFRKR